MEMILNAREVVLLGSGVGCVAVKSVDGIALDNTSGNELVSTITEALDEAHRSDALRPSIEHPMLRRLKIGEEVGHIRRLSSKPSAFYVRSLLSSRDCDAIKAMAQAANMTQARTYGGGTTARTKCEVSWISPPPALTSDVAGMFFSPEALERPGGGCEDLQVLRYLQGGGYSMHHDGNARALTVLYYLNGVGETWLPLADAPPRPTNGEDAMARAALLDPDTDGVRVTGPAAGDALAFFSLDDTDGSYDWSAVHRALPSTGEKWVANHLFRIGGLGAPAPDPREDV